MIICIFKYKPYEEKTNFLRNIRMVMTNG
ncbi:hypothetical protein FKV91_14045 [Clostridium acetobutylicum]|uniref:Uncharacterized protein n=1 Tax=Clostridium acetobutylicum (strain ATCC 824 / DSM 792 / JCM 1419 / IAM 19013 / LMG 5710 / NBRC 13948 / NRRL B-527 / VKM B-1787 / 2291 / W) TaxID=272562 RepID=Q97J40_CLOAB|nr:Hypothetical protein CA_C1446 [Clostridium acetobutylicum ATCC 824]AEI31812.1 hypothetical protein SMB_G1471 [Clostridium acetobutylicum DSM 1731]AWV81338.1 hypothetical protein DK921_14805 [Clostridium acetobutylicum]PSM04622.1 hypothetical protein C7T89_14800 [Clostridium sp. NJ4]TQD47578.1 hypothetical protein FKV91_14045 [Clostridium acetobutylicum]